MANNRGHFNDVYNGKSLDDLAAEAGGYVLWEPDKKIEHHYDFSEAKKYCKEKGIKTSDLTEDDWDMFKLETSEDKRS